MAATNPPRRLLLIRNDRIGDLVLTLPAIMAARASWPDVHLTVLASPYAAPLLERFAGVDEVLADEPGQGAWSLSRRLRAGKFDAAAVINYTRRAALAVWLAGIRQRAVWSRKLLGWAVANRPLPLRRSHPPVHEAKFALEFIRRLGGRGELADFQPRLAVDLPARERVAARLHPVVGHAGPLYGIHPGNKGSAANWPPERYAALIQRLLDYGRIVVTGGPDEAPLLATLQGLLGASAARVAWLGDLALDELVALISLQDALVVSSTGPMHIAGVVGTPVVALFSQTPAQSPQKWAPLGSGHALLQPPPRQPLDRISLEAVESAVLTRKKPRSKRAA